MTHDNDGGPAFPNEYGWGMSLRDWFAGQSLAGHRARDSSSPSAGIARMCCEDADAMLAERAKEAPQRDKLSAIERELVEAIDDGAELPHYWINENRRIANAIAAWYANAKERL